MSHPFLRHRRPARRLGGAAAAAALLGFASPAAASTASLASGTLSITDQPGHASVISVSELANPLHLPLLDKVVVDTDSAVQVPAGCTHPALLLIQDPTAITCDRSAVSKIVLDLGDGDDTVTRPLGLSLLGAQALPLGKLPVEITGGAGDDLLQGGDGPDLLKGGDGDDQLLGFGGDDTLLGGLGADRVEPGSGHNAIDVGDPEVDTVTLAPGSSNDATASANDLFLGDLATARITLVGIDVGVGVGGGSADANASVSVKAAPKSDGEPPSVSDLLSGASGAVAGGTAPAGVTLPVQPLVKSLTGIAGTLGVDVRARLGISLPLGITLDALGLHISVGCADGCEILASGVVDLGDDEGVIQLDPGKVAVDAGTAQAEGSRVTKLNLGLGHEYTKLARSLSAGRCAVVVSRLRVRTPLGSEVVSYALPACGAKLTFSPAKRPVASSKKATRRLVATATCSSDCSVAPRFLMVKSGNRTLARVTTASVKRIKGAAGARTHLTTWKLSTAQEAAIVRGHRGRFKKIRYIVSAKATSGGVTTVGTASFRTRGT